MLQNIERSIRQFKVEREWAFAHLQYSIDLTISKSVFLVDDWEDAIRIWKVISKLKMTYSVIDFHYNKSEHHQIKMNQYENVSVFIISDQ